MDSMTIYVVLACVFGLYMAWGIGANDVANAMGTSVGAKALTLRNAVIVAAIFEFLGAVLAGGEVTSTMKDGILNPADLAGQPRMVMLGMLAALLAAATWLLLATHRGWPVSTTHSIVGALVGFGVGALGISAVQWGVVGKIVVSWITSPLAAAVIAYMLFKSVQALVLDRTDPLRQAKRWVPVYIFLAGFTIALVTVLKGLKNVGVKLGTAEAFALAAGVGLLMALIGGWFISRIKSDATAEREFHYATVEKVFAVLMIVTACAMAFAHGSNDVANAIGPVAAVLEVASTGSISAKATVPFWVLLVGGAGIVVGLATFGRKVMATIGEKITHLTPSRGFAAELAAASTIVVASGVGMPVSTTHTLVGAVLGVGMARGIAAINLTVVRDIFVSWIITVPAGALLSLVFFYLLGFILP